MFLDDSLKPLDSATSSFWFYHSCHFTTTFLACTPQNEQPPFHLPIAQFHWHTCSTMWAPDRLDDVFSRLLRQFVPSFLCGVIIYLVFVVVHSPSQVSAESRQSLAIDEVEQALGGTAWFLLSLFPLLYR